MKMITFIRNNNLYSEPRLVKVSDSLKLDYDSSFITWNKSRDNKQYKNNFALKLNVRYGSLLVLLYLPIWYLFCLIKLFKLKPDIIYACDLECVVPAHIYAKIKKTKIIYDIWDVASHRIPASLTQLAKFSKSCERYFINRVDVVILPDEERLEQLGLSKGKLKVPYHIIYNSYQAPKKSIENLTFKGKKNINIVYTGTIVKKARGIEQIIETAMATPGINFSIYGYGPDDEYFKEQILSLDLPNINFGGRVSSEESLKINQSADILISLLDPVVENFRYASSSKVFEAFSLLKPIITTKNTATGSLVSQTNWGCVIDFTTQSLVETLIKIESGQTTFILESKKVEKYNWEKMAKELRIICSSL